MSVIGARFAGGPIGVANSRFLDAPVVRLEIPGHNPVPLRPHEAEQLARALTEAVADITTASARELRRSASVTEELAGFDG